MLRDVGNYLPDFGAPKAVNRIEPVQSGLDQQLADAERRGREAGLNEARAEARQLLEVAEKAAAERLAEERGRWTSEQSEGLAASFTAAVAATERHLCETLARVLAPFLDAGARERMLSDLGATLAQLFDKGHAKVRISGPADLIEALRSRLTGAPAATEWIAAEAVEVTVECGDALVETQFGAWRDRVAAAIGVGSDG